MLCLQMQVCLRYDHSKGQRDQFIREAEISAPLAHQSILNLYGVILPGLYTDSVALVSAVTYFIVFLIPLLCS